MKQRKIFSFAMFFLILVFIWGQSILPPSASDSQSHWIASYLVKWFGNDVDYVNHIVRKCAHFTEFAALGAVSFWLYGKRKWGYVLAGLIGFGCAFLDETIQIFSSRGPAISDVWLDLSGVLAGILFGIVLKAIMRNRND